MIIYETLAIVPMNRIMRKASRARYRNYNSVEMRMKFTVWRKNGCLTTQFEFSVTLPII